MLDERGCRTLEEFYDLYMGDEYISGTALFPTNRVERLGRSAARAARVAPSGPEGWSISPHNPEQLLTVFGSLKLGDGFRLRAYQFREGDNGNAFVYALPADAPFCAPENCHRMKSGFLQPPVPDRALNDVMEAIEGDKTPWSYICASLLCRQLREFGALWHGADWGTHSIVGGPERPKRGAVGQSESEWHWVTRAPRDWRPRVNFGREKITVIFYTYSGLMPEGIYKHSDSYMRGSYVPRMSCRRIAEGDGGYVF